MDLTVRLTDVQFQIKIPLNYKFLISNHFVTLFNSQAIFRSCILTQRNTRIGTLQIKLLYCVKWCLAGRGGAPDSPLIRERRVGDRHTPPLVAPPLGGQWNHKKPQICIKYSRFITCQSNISKGRGHDHLPN